MRVPVLLQFGPDSMSRGDAVTPQGLIRANTLQFGPDSMSRGETLSGSLPSVSLPASIRPRLDESGRRELTAWAKRRQRLQFGPDSMSRGDGLSGPSQLTCRLASIRPRLDESGRRRDAAGTDSGEHASIRPRLDESGRLNLF